MCPWILALFGRWSGRLSQLSVVAACFYPCALGRSVHTVRLAPKSELAPESEGAPESVVAPESEVAPKSEVAPEGEVAAESELSSITQNWALHIA